jgi:uncharacterized protein
VTTPVAPIGTDRTVELDVIRGFALFGVLLINLYGHPEFALPERVVAALPTAAIDRPLGWALLVLMEGKAQALFSMLFGFGFAMFLSRAEARGADGIRLYLRRVLILLALGFVHAMAIFFGDILHIYALTALILILFRRAPDRLLLGLGLALSLLSSLVVIGHLSWVEAATGGTPPLVAAWEAGLERRWVIFLERDYFAYVRELVRAMGAEWMLSVFAWSYMATVLGRFLIGFWLFRKGWLQRPADHAGAFRRWAPRLIAAGLALGLADVAFEMSDLDLPPAAAAGKEIVHRAGQLVLASGYAAGLVVLMQGGRGRRWLAGLGDVGRMALTNYLMQSLVYLFVFYGFGFGLMRWGGALTCLLIAVPTFALQIAFSRWWLARFRFGPLEWLWRSATYGRLQPFRIVGVPSPTPV